MLGHWCRSSTYVGRMRSTLAEEVAVLLCCTGLSRADIMSVTDGMLSRTTGATAHIARLGRMHPNKGADSSGSDPQPAGSLFTALEV
jgi:hypothetical protein